MFEELIKFVDHAEAIAETAFEKTVATVLKRIVYAAVASTAAATVDAAEQAAPADAPPAIAPAVDAAPIGPDSPAEYNAPIAEAAPNA